MPSPPADRRVIDGVIPAESSEKRDRRSESLGPPPLMKFSLSYLSVLCARSE